MKRVTSESIKNEEESIMKVSPQTRERANKKGNTLLIIEIHKLAPTRIGHEEGPIHVLQSDELRGIESQSMGKVWTDSTPAIEQCSSSRIPQVIRPVVQEVEQVVEPNLVGDVQDGF